jgi:hypothetical protein
MGNVGTKKKQMTQSLINNGKEGNHSPNEELKATPKWICAEDFKPRPCNISGAARVELARYKETGEHFLVIYDKDRNQFINRDTCREIAPGSFEIKITEIK